MSKNLSYREIFELACIINSADVMILSEEIITSTNIFCEWFIRDTNINLVLRTDGNILWYRANKSIFSGHTYERISLDEILSTSTIEKRDKVKLIFLIGELTNVESD